MSMKKQTLKFRIDGVKIKKMCEDKVLTIEEMAYECGHPGATVRQIVTGLTKNPSLFTFYDVARFLEVSVDELIVQK